MISLSREGDRDANAHAQTAPGVEARASAKQADDRCNSGAQLQHERPRAERPLAIGSPRVIRCASFEHVLRAVFRTVPGASDAAWPNQSEECRACHDVLTRKTNPTHRANP